MNSELQMMGWKKVKTDIIINGWQIKSLWSIDSLLMVIEDDAKSAVISADLLGPTVPSYILYYAHYNSDRLRGIHQWTISNYIETIYI
tara:strand:+ start:334 stop:597 length:264 start_codon:yes stop_codon:yes gene_type:complete